MQINEAVLSFPGTLAASIGVTIKISFTFFLSQILEKIILEEREIHILMQINSASK